MTVQSYRDLVVWQKAMLLAQMCYELTKHFPREEVFGLTSQIKRAAVSIPANIAEGRGRAHTKEFLNHLSIARGSLVEVETHLLLAVQIGLIKADEIRHGLDLSDEIGRMITSLRRSLIKRRKNNGE
jgi:four helix bundle protein